MFHKLLVVLALCVATTFAQFGVKGFGCKIDGAGYGGGGGIFGQVNLNKYFSFYPGLDFWYASETLPITNIKHDVMGLDFNLDLKAFIPLGPRLGPYCGLGIVPTAYASRFKPSERETFSPTTDFGGELFVGCDFPLGNKMSGLMDIRWKLGTEYDALKLSLGVMF